MRTSNIRKYSSGNGQRLAWILFTALLSGVLLASGAIASAVWAHETRITRNETCVEAVHEDIKEIKGMLSALIRVKQE
ncbi:MAG: hypothetical protein KAY37_00975 [Phycisphaerae bacterium]|nr:hypothetical protein [Phycisphaerae bacterium]